MMKILRVISSVDPKSGGPIEGLKLSATVLRELGHETELVTLDDPRAEVLNDFPFPVHPQGRWIKKYGYTPRLAQWIAKNGDRFDVAIVHGLWNHASIGGWQGLRRTGLPYAVFTHGMLDPWFKEQYPLKHIAKYAFWSLLQGKVLRDAQAVLFTSEEERYLARGVFGHSSYRERTVAYGTVKPPFEEPSERKAFRASVPKLGDRPYLLFMSRIHPKKGCDLLLQAFAQFALNDPTVDLVIAGPDQVGLKSSLIKFAEKAGVGNRVHWPGMLMGPAKCGAFRGAEAFVLPSHQENFGIVVAEALAFGCPVLISNKVNIWREIEEADAGLVGSDTAEATLNLLNKFASLSSEKRQMMRDASRSLYLDRFTDEAAGKDLEAVLTEIATRPTSTSSHPKRVP